MCAVLLLAAAGTLLAVRADHVESRATITIDNAPFEVWQVIADPDLRPRWMDGVTSAARMTGTPGQAGSSMLLNLRVDQFTMSVFEDVTAAAYPNVLETRTTDNQGTLSVDAIYDLQFASNGTALTVVQTRDLSGTWAVWFAPFVKARADAQLKDSLTALKTLIETGNGGQ